MLDVSIVDGWYRLIWMSGSGFKKPNEVVDVVIEKKKARRERNVHVVFQRITCRSHLHLKRKERNTNQHGVRSKTEVRLFAGT